MDNREAVNWIANILVDIGKAEHSDLWGYEQALTEIKDMLESAQPEEAIPVSWIEAKITQLISMDNEFAGLTVHIIKTMLNEWKKDQEGETT